MRSSDVILKRSIGPDPASPGPGAIDACWSRIGVWGRADCAELTTHIHCRNCPVYSHAAAAMLDGAIPEGYLEEWTTHVAAPKQPPVAAAFSLLVFRINTEWFALPMSVLDEVVERRPIRTLPHMRSAFIRGIVNIGGQLLVCVSLTRLLELPGRSEQEKTAQTIFERLLVVTTHGGRIAIPVSEVAGPARCQADDLRPAPATIERAPTHFTLAVWPWQQCRYDASGPVIESINISVLDTQRLFPAIEKGLA
jgi:chemotaxis-related protein WspD